MPELKTPDGSIHYEVRGEGEPVVLLRGLGRSSRYWLGFEDLAAKSFKVITVDARGIGRSSRRQRWADSLFVLGEDVVAVLDELKISKAHVFGVSLGGMVALAAALAHPDRVKPNRSQLKYCWAAYCPPIGGGWVNLARGVFKRDVVFHQRLARSLVGKQAPSERIDELINAWKEVEAIEPVAPLSVVKQLGAAARFVVGHKLDSIKVPVMIMYGNEDTFVPSRNSKIIHRLIPHSRLVELEGAGHEATYDKPEEIIAEMKHFFLATCK